ncbi:MAG: ABC transporter ATP-binding protein [Polyangiaceae bacterium]
MSFDVPKGGSVCVVGESGSGKSVTALGILGLLPSGVGWIEHGQVLFNGVDLAKQSEKQMQSVRGRRIAMVFQEPMTSLNPVYTVGSQIIEAVRLHKDVSKKEARERAIEVLKLVGMPDPHRRVDAYPHELSGGMRQRVMIAMALSCEPDLLLADEPTTALDVTIQAQILDLLKRLRDELSMSVVLITHDLGVVAQFRRASRRHVCGPSRRNEWRERAFRRAIASVHSGVAQEHSSDGHGSPPRHRTTCAIAHHRRDGPQSGEPSEGLSI